MFLEMATMKHSRSTDRIIEICFDMSGSALLRRRYDLSLTIAPYDLAHENPARLPLMLASSVPAAVLDLPT